MSKQEDAAREGGQMTSTQNSSKWQPSALDLSSPNYSGSMTGRGAVSGATDARSDRRHAWAMTLIAISSALVAGLLVWAWLSAVSKVEPPSASEPVARLEVVRGPVSISSVDDAFTGSVAPARLTAGETMPLLPGTVIDTGVGGRAEIGLATDMALASATDAETGRAAFRLASGASVRLDADSRVRIASSGAVVLERGALYVDSAGDANVEVRTTFGTVTDIGTQFEVRLAPEGDEAAALRVRVREGEVVLHGENGGQSTANSGEELTLHDDGSVTRADVATWGDHWDWVLETAPLPAVEGRSLSAFLDWLSREGGWQLQYTDAATEATAATTILHGDITGLSSSEASAMVFEGSGLDYRLADGAFLVKPME